MLREAIRLSRLLIKTEGIVELSSGGVGFETQLVAVDVDDLVELGVVGDAAENRAALSGVLLGAAHRDDVDGARHRLLLGQTGGGVLSTEEARATVGVVVPLQHEVDFVLVKDPLPRLTNDRVIATNGG